MRLISVILFLVFIVQMLPVLLVLAALHYIPALRIWAYNLLIGIDQFGNTIMLGSYEETISSRLGRAQLSGKPTWYARWAQISVDYVCALYGDYNHCVNAIKPGEDYSSEIWSWIRE
jgi:hypothetical protein